MSVDRKFLSENFKSFKSFNMKHFYILAMCLRLAQGLLFQCHFAVISWTPAGQLYTCRANVVNSGSETLLEGVIGVHVEGRSNADVLGVTVTSGEILKRLPGNLGDFFPSLTNLQLRNTQFETVSAEDLRQLPNLDNFYSFNNSVVVIDGDLFKFNTKIQSINFPDNQVRHVGQNLLTSLSNLRSVNFRNNPCISVFVSSGFEDLNSQLPINCPPLPQTTTTTTTTITTEVPEEICSLRCSLNEETDEQSKLIESLENEVQNLKAQSEVSKERISEQNKRLTELEKVVREIGSNPQV